MIPGQAPIRVDEATLTRQIIQLDLMDHVRRRLRISFEAACNLFRRIEPIEDET